MVSSSAPLLCHNTVIELLVNDDTHALVCTHAHGWPAPSACALSTHLSEFLCDVSATLPLSLKARVKAGGRWAATMSSNALRSSEPDALQPRFMSFLCCLGHHLTRLSVPFTLALSFVPQLAGQPQQRTRMRSLLATRPPSTLVSRYVCFPTVTIHLRSQRVCAQCVRSWTRVLCVWCQEDAHRCGMVPTTSPMPHTIHAPTHPAHH
jgi:hypothetical protein